MQSEPLSLITAQFQSYVFFVFLDHFLSKLTQWNELFLRLGECILENGSQFLLLLLDIPSELLHWAALFPLCIIFREGFLDNALCYFTAFPGDFACCAWSHDFFLLGWL